MTTAVATILEDVRERFHPQIEPPRLCLIVDEISKVKDDRVRDLMFSTKKSSSRRERALILAGHDEP
jgi:hypothetical protein